MSMFFLSLVCNEKKGNNISNIYFFRKDGLEYEPNGFRAGHARQRRLDDRQ